MPSLRFVLSRRWLLFALAVLALVGGTWWLGQWQFDRLVERKAANTVIRVNENLAPAPVADVLAPGRPVGSDDEWRLITAEGTYDPARSVVVRYRSRDEGSGINVVVPLVTADGTTLLVDRGWLETDPQGTDRSAVPDPPRGEVTVTGWVRADGTGDSTSVDDLSTRAISSARIGEAIDLPVFTGFLVLDTESPAPATSLTKVELPELNNGPHFFYGLQWWFFSALAIFGFFYLLYDEWRRGPRGDRPVRRRRPERAPRPGKPPSKAAVRRELVRQEEERRALRESEAKTGVGRPPGAVAHRERSSPPSTGTIAPVTNDAAGASRNAATRPNSSGRP
ncbi:MAG: SURF1 family protein [Nocardioides sp.]|nr:SURF1 family protein [Nocardioides sp.]